MLLLYAQIFGQTRTKLYCIYIDVIIPSRWVSTVQRQNTQHSQQENYYQPRYPTTKTIYPRSWAV